MSRENVELFERNISICINSIYQEKPPTEEQNFVREWDLFCRQ